MARRLGGSADAGPPTLCARNYATLGPGTPVEQLANASGDARPPDTLGDPQLHAHALRLRFCARFDLADSVAVNADLDQWLVLVDELKGPVAAANGRMLLGGRASLGALRRRALSLRRLPAQCEAAGPNAVNAMIVYEALSVYSKGGWAVLGSGACGDELLPGVFGDGRALYVAACAEAGALTQARAALADLGPASEIALPMRVLAAHHPSSVVALPSASAVL